MLLTKDHGTKVRGNRLIAYIEHKLDLTRPDEITEKTRIKGITELSNILTVRITVSDLYSYMGILVDMSGYSAKISRKGLDLIGK